MDNQDRRPRAGSCNNGNVSSDTLDVEESLGQLRCYKRLKKGSDLIVQGSHTMKGRGTRQVAWWAGRWRTVAFYSGNFVTSWRGVLQHHRSEIAGEVSRRPDADEYSHSRGQQQHGSRRIARRNRLCRVWGLREGARFVPHPFAMCHLLSFSFRREVHVIDPFRHNGK